MATADVEMSTAGHLEEHPGQSEEHLGQSEEHPGHLQEHLGQSGEHLGQSGEHPGQSGEHPGLSNDCTEGMEPGSGQSQMSEEKMKEVAHCLNDWGCCVWCIRRFLLDLDHEHYMIDQDEFSHKMNLAPQNNERICVSCLGILHVPQADTVVEKCREKLSQHHREFDSFIVVMKLPVALILREHAILVLLRNKFPEIYTKVTKDKIMGVKSIWKMRFANLIGEKLDVPCQPESSFEIRLQFCNQSDRECNFLKSFSASMQARKSNPKRSEQFRNLNFNQNNVTQALSETPDEVFRHYYQCPPVAPSVPCLCQSVDFFHHSIYMAGRYNKYSREFGQTPWFVDSVLKIETSVEEIITHVLLDKIKPMDHKFMASGREDVDVRMLGRGRPFMIEFINPRIINLTQSQVTALQREINKNQVVKVRDLQIVSKKDGAILKEGEMEKSKEYSALIWCKDQIDGTKLDLLTGMKDLKIEQLTPIRVLHRRTHSVREKMVFSMKCSRIDDHHFKMALSTQAGTYVKEFVHGDFGRTVPNVTSLLGTECDILALDVEEVVLDWPREVNDNEES